MFSQNNKDEDIIEKIKFIYYFLLFDSKILTDSRFKVFLKKTVKLIYKE